MSAERARRVAQVLRGRPRHDRRPVLSTMHAGRSAEDAWTRLVDVRACPSPWLLLPWLVRFVLAARGRRAVVLRGTVSLQDGYADLVAAALLRRVRPGLTVVMSDATLEPGSRAVERLLPAGGALLEGLSRRLVRAADSRSLVWCVLSTAEREQFHRTWGTKRGRVVFTPFSHSLHGPAPAETEQGEHVFSGGNSLRDYDLLLDAWAPDLPPLRVATTNTVDAAARERSGAVVGGVSHADFVRLMATSRMVVVPLLPAARSTGQQTYLNAMRLGRPVVVTEGPGARDHIDDGVTGLVVPRDAEALHDAVLGLARDEQLAARMGEAARHAVAARYEPHHYRDRLLALAGVSEDSPPR